MQEYSLKQNLWNKDFTLFLISRVQSSLGSAISAVALSFLILKLTHSPKAMSITLALQFIPALFTPVIATFIDRMNLKPPLLLSNFLRGVSLVSVYIGILLGFFDIYVFYLVALFNGFLSAIYMPASQSLIPNLIPKGHLVRGNSLLDMANRSMSLIGLIGGGVIVGVLGPELSIFIEGLCYFIVSFLLLFVAMPPATKLEAKNSFYSDFIQGFKYIKTSNLLILLMVTGFFMNAVMAPLGVLLPIYMTKLGKGAFGYGLFTALITCGALFANVVISFLGAKFKCLPNIVRGWLCVSVALAGLGLINSFYLSLGWAFLFGLSTAMLNTGSLVLAQTIVPAEFRGRAFGTIGTACQLGMPISLFILSYLVTKVTIAEIFLSGMTLSIIFVVIWWVFIKLLENQVNEQSLAFDISTQSQ